MRRHPRMICGCRSPSRSSICTATPWTSTRSSTWSERCCQSSWPRREFTKPAPSAPRSRRSRAALAFAGDDLERRLLAEIDEIRFGRRVELGEVREQRAQRVELGSCPERVRRAAVLHVVIDQALERGLDLARRDLRDEAAELGALGRDAAADVDEVLRRGPAGDLAHAALEADAGDVVLAAAVRAAADLDVEAFDAAERGAAIEQLGEHAGEALRRRDGELAAGRAGAARDVGERVRTRLRESDTRELAVE